MSESAAAGSGDSQTGNNFWQLLPSFDPSTDDIREFSQKARFIHGAMPEKDKPNLAPRLAMLCKGTAWSQVRQLDPKKLTRSETGVEYLLKALSTWEETSEMKTYELFERALYKVVQKSDEASHSFSLRLQAAFDEIGDDVTVKQMQAFVMLRQSGLSSEDKKKILTMTNGQMELSKVDQAMRSLSTRVLLGPGETKKKIYPINFSEVEEPPAPSDDVPPVHSTYAAVHEEEDVLTTEHLEYLAAQGDEDAYVVQQFEKDFEEMMQEIPDLQQALVSYQEARQRITDRRKSRGFWPTGKSKGKGGFKDGGRSFRKGGAKSGKDELLARIARHTASFVEHLGIGVPSVVFEELSDQESSPEVMSTRDDGLVTQSPKDMSQCQGMAILDTGASRSVIGSEHVSAMMQKLPSSVREQVDVLEALRTVAEEVLASLRLLMSIVFTMTSAIDPAMEATEVQMNPVNQLIHEVAQQRQKIDQLGTLIQTQFLQKPPANPGPTHVPESGDSEWEAEMMPTGSQAASVVPSSSQQMPQMMMNARSQPAHPPTLPQRAPVSMQPPGTPNVRTNAVPQGSPVSSYGASEIGSQLMVTQASLESWGNKVVTFGKKHLKARYAHVYESDQGYVKWVLSRVDSLSEEVADFGSYARARMQLEQLAANQIQ
eukprot:s350_g23.t1